MSEPQVGETGNGASLAKLLSQLNIPTLAAVLLMGGGNFFATKSTSEEQRQQVFRQVKDLHDALTEFETRQKDILKNQTQMLGNQTQILERLTKQP